jgi:hypothetical protein
MKHRFNRWTVAAFLLSFLGLSFAGTHTKLPESVLDDVLRLTQPVVATAASFSHSSTISRWFLVSDSAKYVSCEYVLFGYPIAITTGCHVSVATTGAEPKSSQQ